MFIKFCREDLKFFINIHLKLHKIKINFLISLSGSFPVKFLNDNTTEVKIVFHIFCYNILFILNNNAYSIIVYLVSQSLNYSL